MKWKNPGHEYDWLFNKHVVYRLWGAAQLGQKFWNDFSEELNIVQIVDNDPAKWGNTIGLLQVEEPAKLLFTSETVMVVTCSYYQENRPIIEALGYEHLQNLFYYEDFYMIYDVYKNNYLRSKRMDISLTEKCTLRCRKCNMFMPYFKNPCAQPIEDVLEDLRAYFSVVDYLKELNLLGGEPFLYQELPKLLEEIEKCYKDKIGIIHFFSNGTMIPTEKMLEGMKKCNVTVQFSDYTHVVPYQKKFNEFKQILEEKEINYEILPWEKWGDFGFPENPNCIEGEENIIKFFDSCRPPFRGLWKKRIYFCHLETSAIRASIFEDSDNDYIEMNESTKKKEFLEFDFGFCRKGYINFCKVCRGCDCVNSLEVSVGEQWS